MKDHPVFVVVGHPNKGKSSIVSALTLDDSVLISDTPGTTKKSRSFTFKVDGEVLYELVDTPGFQRPRKVLSYLKSFGDVKALERPKLLRKFYQEHKDDESFRDECELLKPIVEGAGVIYVVDASKPYSDEYEMEMEILRYSANPSMAILNYIGESDFTSEWDMVLGQYFRLVKKFDPMSATQEDHKDLLEAMSHLNPKWQESMKKAVLHLDDFYEKKLDDISLLIAKSVAEVLSYSLSVSRSDEVRVQNELKSRFREKIYKIENDLRREIKRVLNFKNIEFEVEDKELEFDLLSSRTREVFGLPREKLLWLSAVSGGVLGGGVDLALGGHTFLLGSVIGALGGVATTLWGYEELSKIKFVSKDIMRVGPIKDINFGFVFLNRALVYAKKALLKSHANREKEVITFDSSQMLSDDVIKKAAKYHQKFRKKKDDEDVKEYAKMIKKLLSY